MGLERRPDRALTVIGLSQLYCIILVTVALALPLIHLATDGKLHISVPIIYVCVLFLVAIIFLIYVHAYLLKGLSSYRPFALFEPSHKRKFANSDDESRDSSGGHVNPAYTPDEDENRDSLGSEPSKPLKELYTLRALPKITMFGHGDANYPNFFLRVGAIVFGIGSMLYDGIRLCHHMGDLIGCKKADAYDISVCIMVVLHFIFTFYQLYFLFRNSRISINAHKDFCRFGLMHMVATNVAIWILIVVQETGYQDNIVTKKDNVTADAISCNKPPIMVHLELLIRPYLFPLVVQCSIVCAISAFIMYANIGLHERLQLRVLASGVMPLAYLHHYKRSKPTSRQGMSCHRAYAGLFGGIFFLILILLAIIVYILLKSQSTWSKAAYLMYSASEIVALFVLLIIVIVALVFIQKLSLRFIEKKKVDEILLMASLFCVLVFDGFTLVLSLYIGAKAKLAPSIYSGPLAVGVLRSAFSSIESVLQICLIFDGFRRHCGDKSQFKLKPGRGPITFVLVVNVALWYFYMFQTSTCFTSKDIFSFYFSHSWLSIFYTCAPIVVFFRFLSAACLYDVWKQSYEKQKVF